MSPEAQRIAIAEACGWKHEGWQPAYPSKAQPVMLSPDGARTFYWQELPDYLHDLNAMHEAEKALNDEQYALFRKHLCDIYGNGFRVWSATAAQRAEAFLRTIGKWYDSK